MSLLNSPRRPMAHTLRVLSLLLAYPDAALRGHLDEMREALHAERALTFGRLAEIDQLIDRLRAGRAMDLEAAYVELFDRGRGASLHLFEHVHGDSRDRGPAMVDLIQTYEAAGLLLAPGELPDQLSVLLEYASTQPTESARSLLGEVAHILQVIFSTLLKRQSAYASVLAALLDLAGVAAQPVKLPPEPALDESWEEPPVFGGCSTAGQARPGQPQPVQVHRRDAAASPSTGAPT